MGDLADVLKFFRELPDVDQELVPQLGEPLNTFTLFPKLSLELRLKVWRLCFPNPREILISINSGKHYENYADDQICELQRKLPLPITLHICTESREEALRKYCLIWWKDIGREEEDWRRPICFNPERDMPFIVMGSASRGDEILLSEHIILLKSLRGEQMRKITRLEIKRLDRYKFELRTMWERINRIERPTIPFGGCLLPKPKRTPLESVLQLSALSKVVFRQSVDPAYHWHNPEFDAESYRQRHQTTIAAYLKTHELRFDNGKAPDIVVKPEKWSYL